MPQANRCGQNQRFRSPEATSPRFGLAPEPRNGTAWVSEVTLNPGATLPTTTATTVPTKRPRPVMGDPEKFDGTPHYNM
jgi:hypothetical protein